MWDKHPSEYTWIEHRLAEAALALVRNVGQPWPGDSMSDEQYQDAVEHRIGTTLCGLIVLAKATGYKIEDLVLSAYDALEKMDTYKVGNGDESRALLEMFRAQERGLGDITPEDIIGPAGPASDATSDPGSEED